MVVSKKYVCVNIVKNYADWQLGYKTDAGVTTPNGDTKYTTTIDALRRAAVSTQEKLYIEHVTIYLYTHPEKFKVRLLRCPRRKRQHRCQRRCAEKPPQLFFHLHPLFRKFCP